MERLVVEFLLRASFIVLTAALVLRLLGIKSATAQHAVWAGVLFVMLLLPAWIAWGPKAGVPVLPAQPEIVTSAAPAIGNAPEAPIFLETLAAPAARPPVWNWETVFLGVYLLGAFALLLRLAVGTIRANRLTGASCAAPVTVGFLCPRIVLPAGAADWPSAQLDAVLTHEREHVRRRDPLFQWLALFNRAVFWFHPAAWWLECKLSALAEEACDAAVLDRGHDPREYSEWLLELARAVQQAGTRVNVVAMAMPGSYLPQRIKNIIGGVRSPRISGTRMACAVVTCAIPMAVFAAGTLDHVPQLLTFPLPATPVPQPPILIAQAPAPAKEPAAQMAPEKPLSFDVASIKPFSNSGRGGGRGAPDGAAQAIVPNGGGALRFMPGRVISAPSGVTARRLILEAYHLTPYQLSKGPGWLDSDGFSLEGKADGADENQLRRMLQTLLAERFGLAMRRETKELPVYALVVGKNGTKLHEWKEGDQMPEFHGENNFRDRGTMQHFADFLSNNQAVGRPVLDKTGLKGIYVIYVEWGANFDDFLPEMQEQLGLRLESQKGPVDFFTIDQIDRPTSN